MRRPPSSRRPAPRRTAVAVDVVTLTPLDDDLGVLLVPLEGAGRERRALPWDARRDGEGLDEAARRVAHEALGRAPALVGQVAAHADGRRHPGGSEISVGYFALVPLGTAADPAAGEWVPLARVPALPPRHRAILGDALDRLRHALGDEPIAFRLLPPVFTLTELQSVYERILGRPLHKASFRRALQGAFLVEPTDEWRSEGRGRPAQLFRYAPRKRRADRRAVRFDFAG